MSDESNVERPAPPAETETITQDDVGTVSAEELVGGAPADPTAGSTAAPSAPVPEAGPEPGAESPPAPAAEPESSTEPSGDETTTEPEPEPEPEPAPPPEMVVEEFAEGIFKAHGHRWRRLAPCPDQPGCVLATREGDGLPATVMVVREE